jgi:hypothetical protein
MFENRTWAEVNGYIDAGQVVIGDTADNALASLTPANFLNDPNLGGIFA